MSAAAAAALSPARTDRVRVIIFMAKKDGITNAEFLRYWQVPFGPLFTNLEITKNILICEQVRPLLSCIERRLTCAFPQHHYNNAFQEGIEAMGAATTTFQGMCILEVLSSEECRTICLLDEQNFLNHFKSIIFPRLPSLTRTRQLVSPTQSL
ncbi:hypothetical protein C8Q80DRAFT_1272374 [Daedaleopsis nitida]|nr:hypothetical protein C8Q80DRAFT_1272374 [Daedaleopsis nitida]